MNLKSSNVLLSLALTVVMSAIGTAVCAQTVHRVKPSTSTTKKVAMSPPESPIEFWSRIKILLKKQHGYTSKKDVEDVLGISFKNTEVDGEKRVLGAKFLHTGEQELAGLGLVSLGLFEDPKWSRFIVDWGVEHSETPNCLNLDQATRDLATLGWDFASNRSVMPGRGNQPFFRLDIPKEEVERAKGDSYKLPHLTLFMPNQLSLCVNGFNTSNQRP